VEKRLLVLVLETNPTEVELVSMQIRKAKLQAAVKRVGSMDLLLGAAREAPPDCVLANLSHPRFDPAAAIAASRQIVPGLPWVIYALNGNEETAVQCMKAGAADFVLKRHIARLGVSVKEAIEKRAAPAVQEAQAPPPSEEKPAERSLYQRIVESSPDLIAVLTPDGRREYNNPAYARVLEDPDILVGTDSFLDILEEDRERIKNLFQDIWKRGYGERTEYRLMDRDGETRYIQSNSGMILNDEGDPEKVVVVSRDITDMVRERQRTENLFIATAGLAGEEFFTALVQRLAEFFLVGTVLVSRLSEGARVRTLACWMDGALRQGFEYDVHGSPCEQVVFAGETVVKGAGIRGEFPRMQVPGSEAAEGYLGTPLQAPDGSVIGHLAVIDGKAIEDLPRKEFLLRVMARRGSLELHRMTAPLREPAPGWRDEEARLRTALEGVPYPVVMTDEAGMITLVNARLEELCGVKAHDLIGRRAWPLVLRGGSWSLLKEEYEDVVVRPDHSRVIVGVYAIPCRNAEGRISGTFGILKVRPESGNSSAGA
jgi:PAS domain S-box-containing protein